MLNKISQIQVKKQCRILLTEEFNRVKYVLESDWVAVKSWKKRKMGSMINGSKFQ